ncbi:MAG: hypothetical protein V4733_10570 [Verrucomicrobiota bacterium]
MKIPLSILAVLAAAFCSSASAKEKSDVPRGFVPLAELAEAKKEALEKKRLIVLVVKGTDDSCPNCVATLGNGTRAVGSDVVKVFTRPAIIKAADKKDFGPALVQRSAKHFTEGAAVTFVVMDPAMEKIIVEADRGELQDDKKKIAAFKKTVREAKTALKK